jgi:hypothetical protein
MSDDFYTSAARQRLAVIDAARAQALADLQQHRASGDMDGAAESVQVVANLDSDRANLLSLHRQYVQSQQAPAPEQLSVEERNAKPWDKMTAQDGLELAKTSRYGKDLSFNDPNVIAGLHEVQRRRQRGE